PRNFGTFTRFVAELARGRMPLESAIHKCTGLPAARLGWTRERGRIAPGAAADLLLFDPDLLRDHSTFEAPTHYSTGLDLVVVDGEAVVENDEDTAAVAGRVLLHGPAGGA